MMINDDIWKLEELNHKIKVYEKFFHQIQLHYSLVGNDKKVKEALDIIDDWSYSHRCGDCITEEERQQLIDGQFKKMEDYI